jgi:hypothetical protein
MKQMTLGMLLFLCCVHTASGGIRFSATTERTRVVLGEQIVITATLVSTEEFKNIQVPPLQSTEYFTVVKTDRNQTQSSSIQIVNGRMTQKVEITYLFYYHLSLKKEGTFTFPSLTYKHGRQTYSTKPFPITVSKEKAQSKNISIHIRLNKKSIYKGEQGILVADVAKKPRAPVNLTNQGFYSIIENIEKTFGKTFSINKLFKNKITQSQKRIGGEIYQVFSLSFSVVPLKAGKFTLPPVPFQYEELRQVQRRRRDIFDDFFGGGFFGGNVQRTAKTAYSNRLTVNVLPLPQAPEDFSGAVGSFSLDAEISENRVPSGEAVTLGIVLQGSTRPGNIVDIELPDLPDFEVFTPEKQTSVDATAKGISTRKKYKYLLIPQEKGEKTIPSITWTYFDPAKKSFKTLATQPITLTVTKGKKSSKRRATRYLTQEDIHEVGKDIRYIKTPERIKNQSLTPYKNPLFFVLYPIPFLLALFALLYRIQATILKKDPKMRLRKRALHTAKAAVGKLKKEFSEGVKTNAVARIAEIVENYITHRFGFAATGKTLDELKTELTERKIEQTVTGALVPFLETLDSHRFSGSNPDSKTVSDLLDRASHLIEELERKEKTV